MANLHGGYPYSEGLFEDMNKVMLLQLYWDPSQSVYETLKEYAAFEFSPETAEDVVAMVKILEKGLPGGGTGANAIQAFKLAQKTDGKLSASAREAWRWRILYLRALIDKEMHLNKGQLKGDELSKAFAELTEIYHADQALIGWLRPPVVRAPAKPRDPTTIASSEASADYHAGYAHDGILSSQDGENFWASANRQDVGAWWRKDLGKKLPIEKIQIQFRGFGGVYHFVPKTITFQVSDDGTKWTTVVSKSADVPTNNSPYAAKMHTYELNAEGRYIRLLFEDGTDDEVGNNKVVELVEVKIIQTVEAK